MNIKEIEERSGLTRANIRYYEQEGLLAPARRENKYRDYSEEDLETLLRIALVPVCLILLYAGQFVWSAAVFALACVTDFLDGKIARRNKLITNFGKFADPIADKILTVTMMIFLSSLHMLPVWLPVIVVIRELMVDGLRLIAMEKGRVVAAGWSGKIKTVLQMITILTALLLFNEHYINILSLAVCALTIFSGVQYFWELRDLFREDFGK